MAYAKRYAGGFIDRPNLTTPADAQFLNAVEAALLKLFDTDPSADGQVQQWIAASSKFGPALILNKNVDPAAAIDKSKLNLTGQIVNADVAGAAAIARSKLDFGAGLTNADIAAAAAVAASKLAGYPANQLAALRGDGSWVAPQRKTTAKPVNTTVAATDLLNGEITIAGNALGATGLLRLTAFGDWLQNSGGAAVLPRFQLVFGGTTIFDTGTPAGTPSASATRAGWKLVVEILNTAAGAQVCALALEISAAADLSGASTTATAFTTGAGIYSVIKASQMGFARGYNSAAVDTTANKTLVLNVINGSASASYETKLTGALAETL